MTFHVGQKVVQVNPWTLSAVQAKHYSDVRFSECGVVYTVRDITEVLGIPALRFVELTNPIHEYRRCGAIEQPFPAWNFRPLVDHKSEISFTTGADPDSERFDNRKRTQVPA